MRGQIFGVVLGIFALGNLGAMGESEFRISGDRVIQGKFTAMATDTGIWSDMSGKKETWTLKKDLKGLPVLKAPGFPLLERLHEMALEEALLNIREDEAFMAGAKWAGVWTRDISYSIHLALALVLPQNAEASLREKVNSLKMVIQDTGTGGSWPISTDRVVWGLAAWELYKAHGKKEWLEYAFTVLKNSADRDQKAAFDPSTGLFFGESSFMDWRDQSYPKWMRPVEIYQSRSLSTNVLHKEKFSMLALMAAELGKPDLAKGYEAQAQALAQAIDQRLWREDKGYHASFMYPPSAGNVLSDKPDILGQNLSVLLNAVPSRDPAKLLEKIPVVPFGVPCFYPQIADMRPYHNKGIWPFVTAYYSWAGAKAGNPAAADHGMRSVWRAAALFLTNKENMVYDTGHFDGTAINSDRQLWSVAGMLATVYRTLLGLETTDQGVMLKPWLAKDLPLTGDLSLSGMKIRGMSLDIRVAGRGSKVTSFKVNGQEKGAGFLIPYTTSGDVKVEIQLAESGAKGNINLLKAGVDGAKDVQGPLTLTASGGQVTLKWNPSPDAVSYIIWKDGREAARVQTAQWSEAAPSKSTFYAVQSVSAQGALGQLSAPAAYHPLPALMFEAEKGKYAPDRLAADEGGTGEGYIDMNDETHESWEISVDLDQGGEYLLTFMYSNGNGPISTDNNCGLRTLWVNGQAQAQRAVFAQTEDWGNFMTGNPMKVTLKKGANQFKLTFDPSQDLNMDTEVNGFYLDSFTLQPLK